LTTITAVSHGWLGEKRSIEMKQILHTERLLLRPFTQDDFAAVHAYASNPENVKYMIWGPNNEAQTKSFIDNTIKQAEAKPRTNYDFAIVLKETGVLIGGSGIYLDNDKNQANLGWILHKDYWKQGYGTEFATALLKFGFEELKLHRIYASCHAENYGSYRVMERNGMRREAHFIKARTGFAGYRDEWQDELVYAILAEEYFKG
jgi:RimJ/RimL family protein N-acetyltransferase